MSVGNPTHRTPSANAFASRLRVASCPTPYVCFGRSAGSRIQMCVDPISGEGGHR
jgi:hypothetical protein